MSKKILPENPDKKYYVALNKRVRQFKVDLDRKKWCDLWHVHFDWKSFGNLGPIHRRKHLAAVCQAFRRAQVELALQPTPFQVFLCVYKKDCGSDAVYVHTQNPNGTEFPISFNEYKLLSKAPPLLVVDSTLSTITFIFVQTIRIPLYGCA